MSKRKMNLVEMNETELRMEVGRLETELARVTAKNKRRRTALKQLNTHALVTFKIISDLIHTNHSLRMSLAGRAAAQVRDQAILDSIQQVSGPKIEVQETKRWFHHILPRGAKGVSGA